jgi:hypothetical protein
LPAFRWLREGICCPNKGATATIRDRERGLVRNAARFGRSSEEVVDLQERRRFDYQWLSAAYRAKADVGEYTR